MIQANDKCEKYITNFKSKIEELDKILVNYITVSVDKISRLRDFFYGVSSFPEQEFLENAIHFINPDDLSRGVSSDDLIKYGDNIEKCCKRSGKDFRVIK